MQYRNSLLYSTIDSDLAEIEDDCDLTQKIVNSREQMTSAPRRPIHCQKADGSGSIIPYPQPRSRWYFTRRIEGTDDVCTPSTHISLESSRSQLSIDIWVGMVQNSSVPSNSLVRVKSPLFCVHNMSITPMPGVSITNEDR